MKKAELKKILKPLIKECIREVIFEEGTLSTLIAEVVKGTNSTLVVENQTRRAPPQRLETPVEAKNRRQSKLKAHKQELLKSFGNEVFNGVDLFEGTAPMSSQRGSSMSPAGSKALDGVSPNDSGVDLSGFGLSTNIWKKLAGN